MVVEFSTATSILIPRVGHKLEKIERYGDPFDEEDMGPCSFNFSDGHYLTFEAGSDGESAMVSDEPLVFYPDGWLRIMLTDQAPWNSLVGAALDRCEILILIRHWVQPVEETVAGFRLWFAPTTYVVYLNKYDDAALYLNECPELYDPEEVRWVDVRG